MSEITLNKNVETWKGTYREIKIILQKDNLTVSIRELDGALNPVPTGDTTNSILQWESLEDYDYIAGRFEFETVRTFRELMKMLGQAQLLQSVVQA